MSGNAESATATGRGIRRALVRYGRLGRVGWFGTVHETLLARGDAVVVLTALGEWSGVVLRVQGPDQTQPVSMSGELVRPLSDEDEAAAGRSHRVARQVLEHAAAELAAFESTGAEQRLGRGEASTPAGTSILGADVSLCGRFAMVEFAGRGGAALGPAAVRLADAVGLERVQWVGAASLGVVDTDQEPHEVGGGNGGGGDVSGGRGGDAERQAAGPDPRTEALGIAELLRTTDETEVAKHARRRRERLGMIGAYSQKVRSESSKPPIEQRPDEQRPGEQRPDEAEPAREGSAREGSAREAPKRRWMIRVRATAGGILAGQLERLAELAVCYGDGSLRLTMRQGLQMHGVTLGSAAEVIRQVEGLAMTTRGSCGNVLRNVTCCPLQPRTPAAATARRLAVSIGRDWLPQAQWLSAVVEPEEASGATSGATSGASSVTDIERDAAYPHGYLPHKWKVGIATPEDNCIDVLTGDIGLIVHQRNDADAVVDCYVGGSLAYRPGMVASEAMLAEPLGRVSLSDVHCLLNGLAGLHREVTGERSRHWRRLKYLVRRLGAAELARILQEREGRGGLISPIPADGLPQWTAHPRWTRQDDGRWTRVVEVAGGRLRFGPGDPREGWLRLCRMGRAMRIGPRHSLVIEGIEQSRRQEVDEIIAGPLSQAVDGEGAPAPRVLACVALPTCPLAIAEAERDLPSWRRAVGSVAGDAALIATGGDMGRLTVAVSGCSNGCSHPLTAAIGIVAESPRQFRVFVGGDGRRMGSSIGTIAEPAELAALVTDVAARFRAEQEEGESFSRWWERHRREAR